MSSKVKHQSLTPATQWLRQHDIPFEEKSYDCLLYTSDAADEL